MSNSDQLMRKQDALADRSKTAKKHGRILDRARVYLSGPMDFVASREQEKANGWRTRISTFLKHYGTTVCDPWNKPEASGMRHYGKEDEFTVNRRDNWTYKTDREGARTRAELAQEFWPTLHIDLRMTDLADFLIAYCPTNIYSVGTVHEIVTARLQHKPVLLVTPKIEIQTIAELETYLDSLEDDKAKELFETLRTQVPMRPNPKAIPSLWYMALVESEDYFFDGFGFAGFMEEFGWEYYAPLDDRETDDPPTRPLLPYLVSLNTAIPERYDVELGHDVENPEWLIFVEENAN